MARPAPPRQRRRAQPLPPPFGRLGRAFQLLRTARAPSVAPPVGHGGGISAPCRRSPSAVNRGGRRSRWTPHPSPSPSRSPSPSPTPSVAPPVGRGGGIGAPCRGSASAVSRGDGTGAPRRGGGSGAPRRGGSTSAVSRGGGTGAPRRGGSASAVSRGGGTGAPGRRSHWTPHPSPSPTRTPSTQRVQYLRRGGALWSIGRDANGQFIFPSVWACAYENCCAQTFKRRAMVSHTRSHRDGIPRPEVCETCGNRFTRADLAVHMNEGHVGNVPMSRAVRVFYWSCLCEIGMSQAQREYLEAAKIRAEEEGWLEPDSSSSREVLSL